MHHWVLGQQTKSECAIVQKVSASERSARAAQGKHHLHSTHEAHELAVGGCWGPPGVQPQNVVPRADLSVNSRACAAAEWAASWNLPAYGTSLSRENTSPLQAACTAVAPRHVRQYVCSWCSPENADPGPYPAESSSKPRCVTWLQHPCPQNCRLQHTCKVLQEVHRCSPDPCRRYLTFQYLISVQGWAETGPCSLQDIAARLIRCRYA